jgi:hypothetical protein
VTGRSGDRIAVRWRYSAPLQTGPPSLLYSGYRVFPEGRMRPGRDADPSPLLVPRFKKQSRAISLLSLRTFVACKKSETYLHVCLFCRFTLLRKVRIIWEAVISNWWCSSLARAIPSTWERKVFFLLFCVRTLFEENLMTLLNSRTSPTSPPPKFNNEIHNNTQLFGDFCYQSYFALPTLYF